MTNIYWPVYKNLESETLSLTYNIHIDDNQLNVYSSKISDLILRSAIEIESISKELYFLNGGKEKSNLRFDDAIKHLDNIWILNQKKIIISSINCFQTKRILIPFEKNTKKLNGKLTYGWNNSYQHLKHDRAKSIHFGSIKYLFEIIGALFILNLYYKNEIIPLRNGNWDSNFPSTMGSKLFSIKVHAWSIYGAKGEYTKKDDFDECIYLTKFTDESVTNLIKTNDIYEKKYKELFFNHPKFIKYSENNKTLNIEGNANQVMYSILGKTEHQRITSLAIKESEKISKATDYEAILNKNSI